MLTPTASLLFFYGLFLILCGITAVLFIGWSAKTALISGGTSGLVAIVTGHFLSQGYSIATSAGLVVSFGLFCVFSWRSTKTLFAVFDLIKSQDERLPKKGIAFLIISLMAVVSIIVTILQAVNLTISE